MGEVGAAEVLLLVYLVWCLVAIVICVLKKKIVMAIISAVIGGGGIQTIGAIRLAKPNSWWANRYYDDAKRSRARALLHLAGKASIPARRATDRVVRRPQNRELAWPAT